MVLDYMYRLYQLYASCPWQKAMAFKRSAVRSRLSPPKVLKSYDFRTFSLYNPDIYSVSGLFQNHPDTPCFPATGNPEFVLNHDDFL